VEHALGRAAHAREKVSYHSSLQSVTRKALTRKRRARAAAKHLWPQRYSGCGWARARRFLRGKKRAGALVARFLL
jgi:hypothetical protein